MCFVFCVVSARSVSICGLLFVSMFVGLLGLCGLIICFVFAGFVCMRIDLLGLRAFGCCLCVLLCLN